MKCFVGIDLGSTTTKAVILDQNRDILGKGITNSRSNYKAACAVAKGEAYIHARFALLQRRMQGSQGKEEIQARLIAKLAQYFRLQGHLNQLKLLHSTCVRLLEEEKYQARRRDLENLLEVIFQHLERHAREMFLDETKPGSDFFRDLVGKEFLHIADRFCREKNFPFAQAIGIYDKSILIVENESGDLDFSRNVRAALREMSLSPEEADLLQGAVNRVDDIEFEEMGFVGTGYGRQTLPFPRECIRSEILCHGMGAHFMYPKTLTVLDIGGQDTKAIQLDDRGLVSNFQMNDRCAAGCGRYLGYIADEMNVGVQELGPMAMRSQSGVKINSTCTVFAGAELRERLAFGEKREDIVLGLHRAIILRAMSLLARAGGVRNEFTFTGGVANNVAAVKALRQLIDENYGHLTINIDPSSIYTGALGAALFALEAHPC